MNYFKKCHLENFPKGLKRITKNVYGLVRIMENVGENSSEIKHTRVVLTVMSKVISRP